mgnify:FL=1
MGYMDSKIERIVLSHDEIVSKCHDLGMKITNDYKDKRPILVGLLKGCIPFMSELIKHIDCDMEMDFLEVSSYNGTSSTGLVTITKDIKTDVKNRHVIIVEDIVDTGYTLKEVMNLFKYKGALSCEIAALLDKPSGRKTDLVTPKYVCETIGPGFVVGFGLDYDQLYRNLDYVGILKKEVYS